MNGLENECFYILVNSIPNSKYLLIFTLLHHNALYKVSAVQMFTYMVMASDYYKYKNT